MSYRTVWRPRGALLFFLRVVFALQP